MTDKEFQKWIRLQPSCLSGKFSEWVDGVGMNVFAHHRKISKGAGIAKKPKFSGFPLTFDEHYKTHLFGPSYFKPAEWWDEQSDKYLKLWHDSLK